MRCPRCGGEMQAGTVRVDTSDEARVFEALVIYMWVRFPRGLYFAADGESKQDLLPEGTQRAGHRCAKCQTVVVLDCPPVPLPQPPKWVVSIPERQQRKAPRRAVYDGLRKHGVPYPVASAMVRAFHSGLKVEIPVPEKTQAQDIVDELRQLGLEVVLIEPGGKTGRERV